MNKENTFRIIPERGAKAHPLTIPWSLAELAYSVYAGLYGTGQSLERISERGGFYPSEMDQYVPDWRERCDRCEALEQENARLKELIRDTPFVADMSVIVFSASLPRMETDESKEIAEWLERRKELLND